MIPISSEAVRELLDRVKDGYEVHIRVTEEETEIEVMPWEPVEMKCPYGKGEQP